MTAAQQSRAALEILYRHRRLAADDLDWRSQTFGAAVDLAMDDDDNEEPEIDLDAILGGDDPYEIDGAAPDGAPVPEFGDEGLTLRSALARASGPRSYDRRENRLRACW